MTPLGSLNLFVYYKLSRVFLLLFPSNSLRVSLIYFKTVWLLELLFLLHFQ